MLCVHGVLDIAFIAMVCNGIAGIVSITSVAALGRRLFGDGRAIGIMASAVSGGESALLLV
jgi:hypothetical protein